MNNKYNTHEITEAGLITAIIVVLMLITGYVPVISMVSSLLLPVPVTILALRRGYKISFMSVIIGTGIVAMVYDPITAVQSALTFGFLGLSLAYCIKNKKFFGETIIIMSIASLIASLLSITLYSSLVLKGGIQGIYKLADNFILMIKQSYETTKSTLGTGSMNAETLKQFDALFKTLNSDYLMKLFLGASFAYSMITSYINYLVSEKILKRFKYDIKEPTPFRFINIDAKLGLAVVIIMFAGSLLTKYKIGAGEYMYNSAYYVLFFMLTIQGFSVITYFLLERLMLPKAGAAIIIVLGFTFLSTFAIYIGLADLIFDFRKINKKSLFNSRRK